MGIRVVCPNGHRLHLKAQLAGRRGLCPDCGARFRIPTESSETPQPFAEPPDRSARSTRSAQSADPPVAHADANIADGQEVGPSVSDIPMAVPVQTQPVTSAEATLPTHVGSAANVDGELVPTPIAAASPVEKVQPVQAVVTENGSAGVAQIPNAAVPSGVVDPFDAAPQAQWYVQPPTGGRYGPAKGDVLKEWIAEGRVTADCLVWRDGWPEWQLASTILGSGSEGTLSSDSDALAGLPSGGIVAYRRRKSSKGVGIAMIVILGLACVALLAVLFLLISNGTISLTPPSPAK